MMAKTKRLTNRRIKSVIRPIWPRKKDITFRNVLYIRGKLGRCSHYLKTMTIILHFHKG